MCTFHQSWWIEDDALEQVPPEQSSTIFQLSKRGRWSRSGILISWRVSCCTKSQTNLFVLYKQNSAMVQFLLLYPVSAASGDGRTFEYHWPHRLPRSQHALEIIECLIECLYTVPMKTSDRQLISWHCYCKWQVNSVQQLQCKLNQAAITPE